MYAVAVATLQGGCDCTGENTEEILLEQRRLRGKPEKGQRITRGIERVDRDNVFPRTDTF